VASAAQDLGELGWGVPVILDSGTSVTIAPIDVGRPLRVGTRFEFAGAMWEVTRAEDYARGWVACPVRALASRSPR